MSALSPIGGSPYAARYGSPYNYNDYSSRGVNARSKDDVNAATPRDAFGNPKKDALEDIALPGMKDKEAEEKKRLGIKDPSEECQTCKNRKYKDGSDEMVSFKSPAHISPENAAATVRAHEQEHVSNAYAKAATGNGKVISASVSIHTAICPECGRTYVAGGTTHTQIKYFNEDTPYQKELKSADRAKYVGMNLDKAV